MAIKKDIILTIPYGIHIRVAAKILNCTNRYSSKVELICGSKVADAKRISEILLLNASQGSKISILIEGDDEKDLLQELQNVIY